MSGAALIAAKNLLFHLGCLGNTRRYFALKGGLMQTASRLGLYERAYLQLLPAFVTSGVVAVDVGANFGAYTHALAALVGRSGRVLAFEPVPPVADFLARSTAALPQVTVVRAALSDSSGTEVNISVPYLPGRVPEPALAEIVSGTPPGETWRTFQVKAHRLDDHSDLTKGVRFIKADVEGHESRFLAGAERTIATFRPLIQVESGGSGPRRAALSSWAHQNQYALFSLAGGRVRIPLEQEPLSLNVYLVPSEARQDFPLFRDDDEGPGA